MPQPVPDTSVAEAASEERNDGGEGMRRVLAFVIFLGIIVVLIWLYYSQTEVVPDVTGMSVETAEQVLTDAGFDVGEVSGPADGAGAVVAEQHAEGGRRVWKGSDIDLIVEEGQAGPAESTGTVTTQEPSGGGTFVMPSITIEGGEGGAQEYVPPPTVSPGPMVPSVLGETEAEARSILADAGYGVTVEYGPSTTAVPAGNVYFQDPAPDTVASRGTVVEVWVSPGPPSNGYPYDQPD